MRIPNFVASNCSELVNPRKAYLLAQYAASPSLPFLPASELILIREYLYAVIDLKPQYQNKLKDFIIQIDNQLSTYNHAIIKSNLKTYIEQKRIDKTKKVRSNIVLGISPYELEIVLGKPNSIITEHEHELWVYNQSNKNFKTYFFKDYLLVKID